MGLEEVVKVSELVNLDIKEQNMPIILIIGDSDFISYSTLNDASVFNIINEDCSLNNDDLDRIFNFINNSNIRILELRNILKEPLYLSDFNYESLNCLVYYCENPKKRISDFDANLLSKLSVIMPRELTFNLELAGYIVKEFPRSLKKDILKLTRCEIKSRNILQNSSKIFLEYCSMSQNTLTSIKNNTNLEYLEIDGMKDLQIKNLFVHSNFKNKLKKLSLLNLSNIDFNISWISDYNNIEEIKLDFKEIFQEKKLTHSLFDRKEDEKIWKNLQTQCLSELQKIKNYKNIKSIDFCFDMNIDYHFKTDLLAFKNIQKLNYLRLSGFNLEHLDIINHFESIKNNNFCFLDLVGCRINWLNTENGKTVQELRKKGVEVLVDNTFHYSNSQNNSDEILVSTLLDKLGVSDDLKPMLESNLFYCIEQFKEKHLSLDKLIDEQKQGRASRVVTKVGRENVYKITDKNNYDHEFSVYSTDLGEFDRYKAKLVISQDISNDNIGILVLENLDNKESVFSKSLLERVYPANPFFTTYQEKIRKKIEKSVNAKSQKMITVNNNDFPILMSTFVKEQGAKDLYDYIDHYIYVLALFHSSKKLELNLAPPSHMRDISYIERIKESKNLEFLRLIRNRLGNLENFKSQLREINDEILESSYCPIIGDFKIANTVKGYVIDYDRVRVGVPVEDIAKFLEQSEFNLSYGERLHFLKRYNLHRNILDSDFTLEKQNEIFNLYNKIAFNENMRTLAGKCCNEQDFNNSYYKQRAEYAISRIKELS